MIKSKRFWLATATICQTAYSTEKKHYLHSWNIVYPPFKTQDEILTTFCCLLQQHQGLRCD